MNTSALRKRLVNRIDAAKETYAKFQERFDAEPAQAMIWSDSLFKAAAEIDIYGSVIVRLDKDFTFEEIIKDLESAIKRATRYSTCFSTSQASNLFDAHKLAVLADALELVEDYAEVYENN